jgi:hypothetical protein
MDSDQLEKNSSEMAETRSKLSEQAKSRKNKMEMYDHKRTANAKLSELEQEAKDKSNYLLAKAQMQLEEQEDEIKHLNELMLYAKCVSIRDLQVAEKAYIQKEKKEEDARLDAMAELERVTELKKIEEKEKIRMSELKNGAAKIRQQIMEREELLLLEQDKKDQETKVLLKALQDMAEAEVKEKMSKIKAQKSLMEDVNAANQQLTERKKIQKLAEEEEDRKVLQYVIDKQKRDEENARAVKQKSVEREIELARLRLAQEKVSDKHSQQNALRAQRAFEAHEREWRRKEKEAAEKHAAQEKELREERVKQQDAREFAIAVEAHKMRKEFYENLARQKDLEEIIKKQAIEEIIKKQAIEEHERNKKYALEVKVINFPSLILGSNSRKRSCSSS